MTWVDPRDADAARYIDAKADACRKRKAFLYFTYPYVIGGVR